MQMLRTHTIIELFSLKAYQKCSWFLNKEYYIIACLASLNKIQKIKINTEFFKLVNIIIDEILKFGRFDKLMFT
jgi:hypothetical protein